MEDSGSGKKPGLGERLRAACRRAGLTPAEVAAEVGLSGRTIWRMQNGDATSKKSQAKVEDWLVLRERRLVAADAAAAAAESGPALQVAPRRPPERLLQQLGGVLDQLEIELPIRAARDVKEQRLGAIRRWLFAVALENPEQEAFVGYLRRLALGLCPRHPAGLFWQAVKTLAPLAESEWWTRPWEVEVELCRVEKDFLRKIRRDRWRCRADGPGKPGRALRLELVAVTLQALEICVRTRDLAGVDGCLELLGEVVRTTDRAGWRWHL